MDRNIELFCLLAVSRDNSDLVLLNHFITYYRNLSVNKINFIVHCNDIEKRLNKYNAFFNKHNIKPLAYVKGTCQDAMNQYKIIVNRYTKTVPSNTWFVYADLDEFIEFPNNDLIALIDKCEENDIQIVKGTLVERVSPDLKLNKIRKRFTMDEQFSEKIKVKFENKYNKVCLTKHPIVVSTQNHHNINIHTGVMSTKLNVNHYRWTYLFLNNYKKRLKEQDTEEQSRLLTNKWAKHLKKIVTHYEKHDILPKYFLDNDKQLLNNELKEKYKDMFGGSSVGDKKVVYTISDHNYIEYAITTLSTYKSKNSNYEYIIFHTCENITNFANKFSFITFIKIDYSETYYLTTKYPSEVFWLFEVTSLLKDSGYNKALYVDVDTYCNNSFSFPDELNSNALCAVKRFDNNTKEINTGVIFLNLDLINIDNFLNMYREYYLSTAPTHDQILVNELIEYGTLKIEYLSKYFNSRLTSNPKKSNIHEHVEINDKGVIIHFINHKPWDNYIPNYNTKKHFFQVWNQIHRDIHDR